MQTLSPETLHQMDPTVLGEVLAYLTALWQEDVGTDEAQQRLDPLRVRYPQLSFAVIWEETSYTGDFHYTVLLSMPQVHGQPQPHPGHGDALATALGAPCA